MEAPKSQPMTSVEQILEERKKFLDSQFAEQEKQKEKHQEIVERAARVTDMVKNSPGFLDLQEFVRQLQEDMRLAPEELMKPCAYDQQMNPLAYDVDQIKLGQVAGARQALDVVLGWIKTQEQIIDREAQKKLPQ